MIGRLRRAVPSPSLQRRVGVLTGLAVAIGIALTALAGYFTTQDSLYTALDDELTQIATLTAESIGSDIQTMGGIDERALRTVNVTLVIVRADNTTLRIPGERVSLETAPADLAVARLQAGSSLRSAEASNGELHRIVAVPMPQAGGRYALVMGRSLVPTETILSNLRGVLLGAGSLGVLVAVGLGSLIARTAMSPVRELSQAINRVAQTDALDPIEVRGNDDLSQFTRSFNTMLHSLATSRARQTRLIADASHELRTPLTSLRTNVELLVADEKSGMLPEGARKDILRDLGAQLGEFTALIGDLVQLTRDPVRATRGPVNLREVTEAALERVRRRGPGLTFDVELNELWLVGEADTLERAVTNLLDNAVKFSPAGGTIRVQLEGDQLRISDQGPGIAEADLPHIFDRFYRSEKARNTPGTGLGLSIVAQTVARHGGWVRASRSSEGGAEFTVRLPGHITQAELEAELAEARAEKE